jgi:hypothetical protein
MEGGITDADRGTMLRAALARVGRDELQEALALTTDPTFHTQKAVGNALNALRKHRDPVGVLGKAQYRVALPYVAAAVGDACLARTIELLGDHSDDPSEEQLRAALDQVRQSYSDVTIAVMLASVADGDMPASDLCFRLLAGDERYGVTDWAELARADPPAAAPERASRAVTPEQREARRMKKQRDAAERRKKMEAARKAGEQVRRARRQASASAAPSVPPTPSSRPAETTRAPRLTRRAALTPLQEEEFDRQDPWVAGVVLAWVPFAAEDPGPPGADGKERPCVVVAGSPTHLLVRPGYSEGGVKSRDWKSVALRHWKRAGLDRPTWIDIESLRVPRDQVAPPVGWLSPEDWNALW